MSLFRRLERRDTPNPITYQQGWAADLIVQGQTTYAGTNVSQDSALRMVAVWAAVSIIADNAAGMPLQTFSSSKGNAPTAAPGWLYQPNAEMTPFDFWHRVLVSMLLDGNAYIYIARNAAGTPVDLVPVHPYRVNITRDPITFELLYHVQGEPFTSYELLHIPAFTMAGVLKGLSPIEHARQSIGLGLTAEEFAARFFSQGASMSGVIETPKDLTEAQAKILAKSFQAAHSGTKKAHIPAVISNGGQWKQLSVTPEQAQFLQTRGFQNQQIAALFRVPAYLLDPSVQSSWGKGIEEQNRAFVQFTLAPWLTRIEQAISYFLFPVRSQFVKFNLDSLLRGRTKDRYDAYSMGIAAKFITPNEVRALEGMDPLPGGDDFPVTPVAIQVGPSTHPTPPPAVETPNDPEGDTPGDGGPSENN